MDWAGYRAAFAVALRLAVSIASTRSVFDIAHRPRISSRVANSRRCALVARAFTPPAVLTGLVRASTPDFASWSSLGPGSSFGSQ